MSAAEAIASLPDATGIADLPFLDVRVRPLLLLIEML
jgi:hypothetical protein